MPSRRDPRWLLLLAFALASATHVALVMWLVRVDRLAPIAVAGRSAAPTVAPAPALIPLPKPPPDDEPPIGEKTGAGEAIKSVESPEVSRSPDPHDVDQTWALQRPIAAPPPPQEARPEAAAKPVGPTAPPLARPTPKPVEAAVVATPEPTPAPEPPKPTLTVPPEPKPPAESKTAAVTPVELSPPSPAVATARPVTPDPAPRAESDLDPFAKSEGVDFSTGKVEARTGRPVKLTRPRVDLRFMTDVVALSGRSVTIAMQIETDEQGSPRKVDVVHSSGSAQIDDAVRLAMYASYFGGKMPDSFAFSVRLWK